jgi:hypothetical protein
VRGEALHIDIEKMQVTFVEHRGFAPHGSRIYYIATEASVNKIADALVLTFVDKTGSAMFCGASLNLYVFTNVHV